MDAVKSYLLSVIAAAIISGIVIKLTGSKSAISAVIKLVCGLFITVTVISPLSKIHLDGLLSYYSDFSVEAEGIVSDGAAIANEETEAIIKQQVEAYILDKASSMQLEIQVDVGMSETQPLVPEFVTVRGNVSPYLKQRLEEILLNDLGIAKENQHWE